jgi:hypothetical protein
MKSDLMKLVRQYRKLGWSIEKTNSQHYKWVPPNGGEIFFTSSTPSDWRTMANVQGYIKRASQPVAMRYNVNQT